MFSELWDIAGQEVVWSGIVNGLGCLLSVCVIIGAIYTIKIITDKKNNNKIGREYGDLYFLVVVLLGVVVIPASIFAILVAGEQILHVLFNPEAIQVEMLTDMVTPNF